MISHYILASSKPSVQGSAAALFCFSLRLGGKKSKGRIGFAGNIQESSAHAC